MPSANSWGTACLLLVVVVGCTVTTTTGSSDACSQDSTVSGCGSNALGYSCTGSATPDQSDFSLTCGMGVPGNASSTLYCCTSGGADGGATCAQDSTVSCPAGSAGYSCTGSDTPDQDDPSLSCGASSPGNANSFLYCCTAVADGGSTCAQDPTVQTCAAGSIGYFCTGSDTPDQSDTTLVCGSRTAGDAGSSTYCCSTSDGGTGTCTIDTTQSCPSGTTQYACTGTTSPSQANGSLLCGPGSVDGGPTTAYCCSILDAGPDAGACAAAGDTGNAACDTCLATQCCPSLTACGTPNEAGVDDAGLPPCRELGQCLLACLAGNPEAGVDGGTLTSCSDLCSSTYTAMDLSNAQALITCQTTTCLSQCP